MTLQIAPVPLLPDCDWPNSPAARAIARAFTPPPDAEIWEWADENVMLQNEDAAEPGDYRSAKTPWTRRLQGLMRRPYMWMWNFTLQRWQRVPVHEVSVQKSSQSGYSEAALNGIRWRSSFRPCNVIYAIDSADEAGKIAGRLLRSLKLLDPGIFKGNPNDIKTLWFKLRGMEVLFYGAGAEGKWANKQAPLRVNDEIEEHKFTNTAENLTSRGKTAQDGGFQVNLSKPKFKDGPINKLFTAGNQEAFFVPCPHCGLMQPLTFFPKEFEVPFSEEMDEIRDEQTGEILGRMPHPLPLGEKRKMRTGRIVFDHCRNLLGKWDQLRILHETYYECANPACVADEHAKGRIEESSKRFMIDRGEWRPMVVDGRPGVVSQQGGDLCSEDSAVTWGRLVLLWLDYKRRGTEGMRTFYNHYLGEVWNEQANVTTSDIILSNMAGKTLWFVDSSNSEGHLPVRTIFTDEASAERLSQQHFARGVASPVIRSFCPPYKRGVIPFECYKQSERSPGTLLLGADVGGNYAKWAVAAVAKNLRDLALIDWGVEIDPESILHVMLNRSWKMADGSAAYRVLRGFIDARHRTKDVYSVCISSNGLLIPTMGSGGATAQNVKLFSFHAVPPFNARMKQLTINKQRQLDATYIEALQKKRRRLWVPVDMEEDPEMIDELCAEEQEEDRRGRIVWKDPAPRPNHGGDCVANIVSGLDFLTRDLTPAPAEETQAASN